MKPTILAAAALAWCMAPSVWADDGDSGYVPSGYKLVWADEFSGKGPELDTANWTHEVKPAGWVNRELQTYVAGAAPDGRRTTRVEDGKLKITALKQGGKVYSGRVYARVKQGWLYGYFEARIKLPRGRGTWPAFWMMPVVRDGRWPHCGEIDIMEEVGYDPGNVSATIHCTRYNNGATAVEHGVKHVATAESDFHVYGCLWTADGLSFYVDGSLILSYPNDHRGDKDTWPFCVPFYPILNLAWGGSWGGSRGVDEAALPATMEVDYLRVYKPADVHGGRKAKALRRRGGRGE